MLKTIIQNADNISKQQINDVQRKRSTNCIKNLNLFILKYGRRRQL
jgi:hypothetical protein